MRIIACFTGEDSFSGILARVMTLLPPIHAAMFRDMRVEFKHSSFVTTWLSHEFMRRIPARCDRGERRWVKNSQGHLSFYFEDTHGPLGPWQLLLASNRWWRPQELILCSWISCLQDLAISSHCLARILKPGYQTFRLQSSSSWLQHYITFWSLIQSLLSPGPLYPLTIP